MGLNASASRAMSFTAMAARFMI
jgi:hypothetical protein